MSMSRFSVNYKVRPENIELKILGLMRLRNESLILEDTLAHFRQFVDGIVCFDDCSNDDTLDILNRNKDVIAIIQNKEWYSDRISEETVHRQLLLDIGRKYSPNWFFYSDCDERFVGNIKEFLSSDEPKDVHGIRISLFDAYMTLKDQLPYERKQKLLDFRKYFGSERRDILMIWRNIKEVEFVGVDAREPLIPGKIITRFFCQHYGKALSEGHWEDTCKYYSAYFPEPYKSKWLGRMGKAIHVSSDFDTPLYTWDAVIKTNCIIHPMGPNQ